MLLNLNVAKCHFINFSKMNPCHSYFFLGHLLSSINTEQDPIVTTDNKLKFSTCAKKSAAAASSTMRLIKHAFSPEVFCSEDLPKGHVHPKLEVGIALVSPYFKKT